MTLKWDNFETQRPQNTTTRKLPQKKGQEGQAVILTIFSWATAQFTGKLYSNQIQAGACLAMCLKIQQISAWRAYKKKCLIHSSACGHV